MSVELGNREVQMITDAIKSVVNDAIKFGNPENFKMLDGSYMKRQRPGVQVLFLILYKVLQAILIHHIQAYCLITLTK